MQSHISHSLLALAFAFPARPVAAAEAFQLSSTRITLEGGAMDVPALKSSRVVLSTFHLGGWSVVSDPNRRDALVFSHPVFRGVRLAVSALAASETVESQPAWKAYQARQRERLGAECGVELRGDSTAGNAVPKLFGWTTFEADFEVTEAPGRPAGIERHLVTSSAAQGVAFVVSGSRTDIAQAEPEFRMLINRLRLHSPE